MKKCNFRAACSPDWLCCSLLVLPENRKAHCEVVFLAVYLSVVREVDTVQWPEMENLWNFPLIVRLIDPKYAQEKRTNYYYRLYKIEVGMGRS